MSTISLADCREQVDDEFSEFVHDNTICTVSAAEVGVCYGDAGGPLFVNNAVVGVISWENPCGGEHPDVFAKVSSHAEWIESTIDMYD